MEESTMNDSPISEVGRETISETHPLDAQMQQQVVEDNYNNNLVTEAQPKMWAGKYNSPEDLEKGYEHAQAKIHQKLGDFHGAPEDGYSILEHDGDEAAYNIDTENLAFQAFLKDAKADNMSQAGFDKYVDHMTNYIKEMQGKESQKNEQAAQDALNDQVNELGGWAAVEGMTNQIANGLANEGLSQPQVDALIGGITNATGLNALKQLVNDRAYSDVPNSAGTGGVITQEVLLDRMRKAETMHAAERFDYDAETKRMFEQAYPGHRDY